jgi:hypothetical protein
MIVMLFVARIPKRTFITALAKNPTVIIASSAEKNVFIANALYPSTQNVRLLKNVQETNVPEEDHLMMR